MKVLRRRENNGSGSEAPIGSCDFSGSWLSRAIATATAPADEIAYANSTSLLPSITFNPRLCAGCQTRLPSSLSIQKIALLLSPIILIFSTYVVAVASSSTCSAMNPCSMFCVA